MDIGHLIGNNNHDVVPTSQLINFGVADASHYLANKLGIHTVEWTYNVAALVIINAFTISFVAKENKFIVMDSHCLIFMASMEL